MYPQARTWRELVKQVVIVLNYKGAQLNEQNIKDKLGPKWAWKLGRLLPLVQFEIGDWQAEALYSAMPAAWMAFSFWVSDRKSTSYTVALTVSGKVMASKTASSFMAGL